MEHETFMQQQSKYRAVAMRTDKEAHWVIRGHNYIASASGTQQNVQITHSRSKGSCESWEDNNE